MLYSNNNNNNNWTYPKIYHRETLNEKCRRVRETANLFGEGCIVVY
jgi:hypothetical protein